MSPLFYLTRGDTYRYKGDFSRALADYDGALRVRPDYIPAFVGRGLTFEKQGNLEDRAPGMQALNSRSQFRGDTAGEALDTARARLAAFDSGAPQPVIPPAPLRRASADSIPTPAIAAQLAAPAAVAQGRRVALIIGNAA